MKRLIATSKQNRIVSGMIFLLLAFLSSPEVHGQSGANLWKEASATQMLAGGARHTIPQVYGTFALDVSNLRQLLAQAPQEKVVSVRLSGSTLTLPLPGGASARFRFVETAVMSPELAARFPQIRTYSGIGIDDPSLTAVFDLTPAGFHGMIHSPAKGLSFIDPYSQGDARHYIVYAKKDYRPGLNKEFKEVGVFGENSARAKQAADLVAQKRAGRLTVQANNISPRPSGDELRTYRIAIAATGEYTAFHGGTVPLALAAITTTLNRLNFIFIREVAIRMQLVANNSNIIYTNSATDPYSNGDPGEMIDQVQTDIDTKIGSAHYDIGHVFGTNSGGLAYLGVVCEAGFKARGVTGSGAPVGDAFDVDYVAHEVGHQFGASHTFNGNEGGCAGNRVAETAFEPGSGSSIMAYSGLCGSQNLQTNSDAYFHTASYDEIFAFSEVNGGNDCAVITSSGNNAPVPGIATPNGLTIPKSTPFTITGSATDPDNDPVTYNWEEYDLGAAGHPNAPTGNAPIFRTFTAGSSPSRTFPKLSDILNNTSTIGEILPSYARQLEFNLTVRDNFPGGGGVDWVWPLTINVSGTAGPFLVTSPNTNLTFAGASTQTITWDVAGTNVAPVNCSHVHILFSADGGLTFPTVLASNVPNDGSHPVTIPNVNTTSARIKIEAVANIFFDISNSNFTVTPTTADQQVQSFTLIDARHDQAIQPLNDGDVINLATLPSRYLNIRANTDPLTVGSVKFALSGQVTKNATENSPPYALYGNENNDYLEWQTPVGSYTLTATPYPASGGAGTAGTPRTIHFTVINQAVAGTLTSFSLLNSKTDQVIQTLNHGDVINIATLPSRNVNIRANTDPATVGSVKFALSGQVTRKVTENSPPYALYGDVNGNYNDWYLQTGNYALTGTPYSASNGGGMAGTSLTISFSVVNQAAAGAQALAQAKGRSVAIRSLTAYPNPTGGQVRVMLAEAIQGELTYTLVSLLGSKVAAGARTLAAPTSELEFDFSNQMRASGIYYLRLEGAEVKKVIRLIRQ